MKRNRWLIALSAMGLHLCIGSVYAWSVLTKPIMESMGFTLKETTWTFSLAILFLGLSAGFLGSFVQKIGPRKSGLLSMTCFVTAMFGTAAALYAHSLPMLYAFYGVIGGIGLGTGYITPVSTLVKWFPENRGFATGLAIMGFGFASSLPARLCSSWSSISAWSPISSSSAASICHHDGFVALPGVACCR